jgi:hypothetical protein
MGASSLTLARNALENLPLSFRGLTTQEWRVLNRNVTIMSLEMGGAFFIDGGCCRAGWR